MKLLPKKNRWGTDSDPTMLKGLRTVTYMPGNPYTSRDLIIKRGVLVAENLRRGYGVGSK